MAVPFIVGMNGKGAWASDDGIISRDLSRHGEWVVTDGPAPYTALPAANLDFDKFFPTSFPSGVSGVLLKMWDGAYIGPIGTYELKIDPRFTVTNNTGDADVVMVMDAPGRYTITIGGQPRVLGWNLFVNGPFASLAASERGMSILPKNDPHPERLYSEQVSSLIRTTGIRWWRAMEDWRANYSDANLTSVLVDRGAKTGHPSAPIDALVQMCNDHDCGLTINIRMGSPPAYVQRIATYVAANLKKGLGFKIEYTNEPWNNAFWVSVYLPHAAWVAGLTGAAENGPTKPACVGWTTTGITPSVFPNTGFTQPFLPNYKVNPNDGAEAFKGRTTQALTAGTYAYGGVYGTGNNIYLVNNDVPTGTVFPAAGDANFTRVADNNELQRGVWRFYADQLFSIYTTMLAAWTAAGHDAAKCRPVINVQSGPGMGVEKEILDRNDNALWKTPFSVQIAPYFYGIFGDEGSAPLPKLLDQVALLDKADIEYKQHWVRDRRAAIQAACPAGIAAPGALCCEIYEWAHHTGFYGTGGRAKYKAYRRDRRLGINFKYGLTLHARDNPGTLLQIFASTAGDVESNAAWGVNFWAGEAGSGAETNPEGIGLTEWNAAAVSGVPTADVLYETAPDAGVRTVSVIVGPNISTAFTGVVRASGTRTFDLPFTKAANSAIADVTYTAIPGDALTFTIVPQPGVFTVGKLSGGDGVVPPVDPPIDPPIDPPVEPPITMPIIDRGGAILHQYRDVLGCAPVVCLIAVGIGVARAFV